MRLFGSSVRVTLGISVFLGVYTSVLVNGLPNWVWNPDAATAPDSVKGSADSSGRPSNQVILDPDKEKDKVQLEIVDTQARLFPSIISALSNSINGANRPGGSYNRPGGSGSASSSSSDSTEGSSEEGGDGATASISKPGSETSALCMGSSCTTKCSGSSVGLCIGSAIASQAIEQGTNAGVKIAGSPSIFGNFLQNIFGNSASTLPGSVSQGGGVKDPVSGGSCNCIDERVCFLPSKPSGSCGGSRVNCCSGTRTIRFSSSDDDRINSVRGVTRSQIRRELFKNIVRGSGSVIDDTLDLILHPFLSPEDERKVATRVLLDS